MSVIGGGVVGLCVGLSLQERGLKVCLWDAESSTPPASWGNAGRIAVESGEPLASFATLRALPKMLFSRGGAAAFPIRSAGSWFPFGLRFLAATSPARVTRARAALHELMVRALPAWRGRLFGCDASPLLHELGHLSAWESAQGYRRAAAAWQVESGAATVARASAEQLRALQSLVRRPIAGLLAFGGTAHIADADELLATLRATLLRRGGELIRQSTDIATAKHNTDAVVVAAGPGSRALLAATGHVVPLIAERGYHIQQTNPAWPVDMPPIHFEDREVVVTRFRSTLRATSFVEFSRIDAPPDPRKWLRLRKHLSELGVPIREDATQWMGSRPTLPDYLPAIGRSHLDTRVFYAFGHQHLGLTLAAITGDLLAAAVAQDATDLDLRVFDLRRFS